MRMSDIGQMYAAMNVYREETRKTVLRVAALFDERAGITDIANIDYTAIQRFKDRTLIDAEAKTVTYNGYLRYLKLLGRWATDEGLMERNWFERVRLAPQPVIPHKTLDDEAFVTAFQYLKRHPDALKPAWFWMIVIRFLYYTGIRRRQLVSIEWQDLDLDARVLIASYRGSKTHRQWEIPLAVDLIDDLEYLIRRNKEALGRSMQEGDSVFNVCRFYPRYKPDPHNPNAMRPEQVTGFFKRLSKQTGMRIGAHPIRHTTATALCNPEEEDGLDLFAVQHLLGHTMLSTTRGYVQTRLHRVERQVSRLSLPK